MVLLRSKDILRERPGGNSAVMRERSEMGENGVFHRAVFWDKKEGVKKGIVGVRKKKKKEGSC